MKPQWHLFLVLFFVTNLMGGCSDDPDPETKHNQEHNESDASTGNDAHDGDDAGGDHDTQCAPECAGDLECDTGICRCSDDLTRCGDKCHDSDGVCSIDIEGFAFEFDALTIETGTTVRWTNRDRAGHTVTSGSASNDSGDIFDSGDLSQDDEFEWTFDDEGSFPYYCIPHATTMQAEIEVVAP